MIRWQLGRTMGSEAQSAGPEPVVFRPWFGFRICLVLVLPLASVALGLGIFTLVPLHGGVSVVLQALAALMVIAIANDMYVVLSTKYRVVGGVLHVHEGGLDRRIELDSISRINTKGPMFGGRLYGLATRVCIYYRIGVLHGDRRMCVTLKDVDAFLAAIGARRTASGDIEVAR